MIHGDYYRRNAQANEHRRPVLLQAWYANFADVVFNEVILNPKYGPRNRAINNNIGHLGAHDILHDNVDCLRISSSYFVPISSATSRDQVKRQILGLLDNVINLRNVGTHNKIEDSNLLRVMLYDMISFCDLLLKHDMETERCIDFMVQCQSELANMTLRNRLY